MRSSIFGRILASGKSIDPGAGRSRSCKKEKHAEEENGGNK